MSGHARVLLCLFLAVSVLGGCETQRQLHISSEPTGALVYVNDEEVGRTPLNVPFTFYGVYDVRLEADAHEPLWTEARAEPPWWELPGPDLPALLVPGREVRIEWHFELEPARPFDEQAEDDLLERAERWREEARGQEE